MILWIGNNPSHCVFKGREGQAMEGQRVEVGKERRRRRWRRRLRDRGWGEGRQEGTESTLGGDWEHANEWISICSSISTSAAHDPLVRPRQTGKKPSDLEESWRSSRHPCQWTCHAGGPHRYLRYYLFLCCCPRSGFAFLLR